MTKEEITPNSEQIHRETKSKVEFQYFNEEGNPVHLCKIVFKNKPIIKIFPYSYSKERGVSLKKVKVIELHGWEKISDVPSVIRSRDKIRITAGEVKLLMNFLYKQYPQVD